MPWKGPVQVGGPEAQISVAQGRSISVICCSSICKECKRHIRHLVKFIVPFRRESILIEETNLMQGRNLKVGPGGRFRKEGNHF